MRNMRKKFSHLYLPAEILLGCSEDFFLRKDQGQQYNKDSHGEWG